MLAQMRGKAIWEEQVFEAQQILDQTRGGIFQYVPSAPAWDLNPSPQPDAKHHWPSGFEFTIPANYLRHNINHNLVIESGANVNWAGFAFPALPSYFRPLFGAVIHSMREVDRLGRFGTTLFARDVAPAHEQSASAMANLERMQGSLVRVRVQSVQEAHSDIIVPGSNMKAVWAINNQPVAYGAAGPPGLVRKSMEEVLEEAIATRRPILLHVKPIVESYRRDIIHPDRLIYKVGTLDRSARAMGISKEIPGRSLNIREICLSKRSYEIRSEQDFHAAIDRRRKIAQPIFLKVISWRCDLRNVFDPMNSFQILQNDLNFKVSNYIVIVIYSLVFDLFCMLVRSKFDSK